MKLFRFLILKYGLKIMLTGFKTYIGVFVYLIGLTGLADMATPEQWEQILFHGTDIASWALQIAGAVLAIVGIIHKDIRLKKPV